MNNNYSWLAYIVIFIIAVSGCWIGYQDYEKILAAVSHVGVRGFLFLCLFYALSYALRFLRWKYLLNRLGDRVELWEGLRKL